MIKIKDIYSYIDIISPFNLSEEWDNTGIILGDPDQLVQNCLVTIDITKDIISHALDNNVNLILSHHPLIFNPIKNILSDTLEYSLIKNNIAVISAHTNLDKAPEGISYQLAKALKLNNIITLDGKPDDTINNIGFCKLGELDFRLTATQFLYHVKKCLNLDSIKYTLGKDEIKTVAVISGSGSSMIKIIYDKADAFITSDVKHNILLSAYHQNLMLLDIDHYKAEYVIIDPLIKKLKSKFNSIKFINSNELGKTVKYYI